MKQEYTLDVSVLACPEPVERVLEAIGQLACGQYMRVRFGRDPHLLYPLLEQRGYAYSACMAQGDHVQVLIWRQDDAEAEAAARLAANDACLTP